jgi:hypothetical protein
MEALFAAVLEPGTQKPVMYGMAENPQIAPYPLAREFWHRRKHGYVRRAILRMRHSSHSLVGNSVVANTSGRSMTSGGARKSSVPIPT